jgi:hypothetical protein
VLDDTIGVIISRIYKELQTTVSLNLLVIALFSKLIGECAGDDSLLSLSLSLSLSPSYFFFLPVF